MKWESDARERERARKREGGRERVPPFSCV